jgi:hypothetical protein
LHDERDALLRRITELEQDSAATRPAREENRLIITEYPYHPRMRPIEKNAGGAHLIKRFNAEDSQYAATMLGIARHMDALLRIPRDPTDSGAPFWANDWFPPFDAASLYGLIAERAPRRYIEVGSGMSTRFARRAISDQGLPTKIISIDPHPHTDIDAICDEVVRSCMEDVPREFWEGIGPDDLLFVDNSHRSFPNSDVTVFFTEVLPTLPAGTIWGLHDILLPWDYPEEWRGRFYNEQYLLMAYLLGGGGGGGGGGGDEIILPVKWASDQPHLHRILAALWERQDLISGLGTHGGCFWMRKSMR